MDPRLRAIQSQEEVLEALARDAKAASAPGFQAFLSSKRAELALQKKQLVTESIQYEDKPNPVPCLDAKSSLLKGPKSRYQVYVDPDLPDPESSSLETDLGGGFRHQGERTDSHRKTTSNFGGNSPSVPYGKKPDGGKSPIPEKKSELEKTPGTDSASGETKDFQPRSPIDLSYSNPDPAQAVLSPRERRLLQQYLLAKERAETEQRKAKETVLEMREQMLKEKEKHLDQMIQLMQTQASPPHAKDSPMDPRSDFHQKPMKFGWGQSENSPFRTGQESAFAERVKAYSTSESLGGLRLQPKQKQFPETMKREAWSPFQVSTWAVPSLSSKHTPKVPDEPIDTPDQEECERELCRMCSNESEALRDEYQQNFESAVLEEEREQENPTKDVPETISSEKALETHSPYRLV